MLKVDSKGESDRFKRLIQTISLYTYSSTMGEGSGVHSYSSTMGEGSGVHSTGQWGALDRAVGCTREGSGVHSTNLGCT